MPTVERPSLLWPGRPRAALARWDLLGLSAVYVLAVAVRWSIRDVHPYTAEAAHYSMSLHLWRGVTNVGSLFADVKPDTFSWFFWQRPLLLLLYWPAASLGFAVYRVAHILVAGTVPVLAAVLLRHLAVRPAHAHVAAAILAIHPVLVPWGVLVLPDTTVAAFTLGALLAAHDGRPWATAGLLLAAAWVKETAFVTTAALLVLALWRDADGTRSLRWPAWPLRLGPFARLLLPTLVLSFAPLYVSVKLLHGAMPGFRPGGDMAETLQRLFLLLWLAPLLLVGLLLPRVRRLALLALAWPAFFIVYHVVMGKAIEVWYNVVPATMTLIAAAATLSHLTTDLAEAAATSRRWLPNMMAAVGVLFAALLLVQVGVPQGQPLNTAVATPLDHHGQWDLRQALASEQARDDDLFAAIAQVPSDHLANWTALDMDYSLIMYPMAETARHVNKDFTMEWNMTADNLAWWADAVERRNDAVFLHAADDSLNHALREAYAPCAATFGDYTVIQAQECQGYEGRLYESWHRWHDGRGL